MSPIKDDVTMGDGGGGCIDEGFLIEGHGGLISAEGFGGLRARPGTTSI